MSETPQTCGCRHHFCAGMLVIHPKPKDGRWYVGNAYFEPGALVLTRDVFSPRRLGRVEALVPSRKFPRIHYRVRYEDGSQDTLMLEALVGWYEAPDRTNEWGHGWFQMPKRWRWPGVTTPISKHAGRTRR